MKAQAIPLEALLRRVSRLAEKHFDKHGDLDPLWLVETEDDEQEVLITKQFRVADMRRQFAEMKVCRYAVVAESWKSNFEHSAMDEEASARRYAELGYTLANAPNREEIIAIYAVDGREVLMAMRTIIRPAHGRAYLGKLDEVERPDFVRSDYVDLLPRESKSPSA